MPGPSDVLLPRDGRRLAVVATMLVTAGLVMGSVTMIVPALSEIGVRLDARQSELQWIVDLTAIILAALLLGSGALLDRFGRRRGLVLGLVLLTAALVWCAVAGSVTEMLVARAATGVGAALAFPATLATVVAVTPAEGRPRVVGAWAGATMLGGTVGLLTTGAVLEAGLWWSSFFLVAAAVALACLVLSLLVVPETATGGEPLDLPGMALSLVAVGAPTTAIIELPELGIGNPVVLGAGGAGLAALVAFVLWELRTPHPMLDVRLFRRPAFTGGVAAIVLVFLGTYGWYFLSFYYFGVVLGHGPLQTTANLIPPALSTVPCAVLGARLGVRWGWRPVVVAALVALAAGTACMALAADARAALPMLAAFVVFGVGLGLGQSAPTQAIVDALPANRQGVASAVNDTSREVGAALGIALLGSAFNLAYRSETGDGLGGAPAALREEAREAPGVGLHAAERAGALGERVRDAVVDGTVAGWQAAFATATVLFLASAVAIVLHGHLNARHGWSAGSDDAPPPDADAPGPEVPMTAGR